MQYADFAVWQRDWLQGEVLAGQLDYWRKRLEGLVTPELLTDHPRPAMQTYSGAHEAVALGPELSMQLTALAQREGATLFMVMLAAFKVLLQRYTGQDDLVVGSPIANRNRAEIEGLIGFFVNTLVLRTELSGDPSFSALLARVRETALGAYAHQDLPFEKLVDELEPQRDPSRNPLFQVMFAVQNAPLEPLALEGLTLSPIPLEVEVTRFDLEVHVWGEASEGLETWFIYNTDLFEAETVRRMLGHYQRLLQEIVVEPGRRLSEYALLSDVERHQVLEEWNDTGTEYPREATIQALFEAQVECTPDAVAVVFEGQELTYEALNVRANQLAHYLIDQGVGPDALVGIALERSLELVVGILGILKAGGAYVPLDPAYPAARLQYMVSDTQTPLLLTHSELRGRLPETRARVVCLDTDWDVIAGEVSGNPAVAMSALDLAYIIYTSGSTGHPKGVCIAHRSVVRLVRETNYLETGPQEVFLQYAPASFDASTLELWGSLLNGGRLVVCPPGVLSLEELGRLISEQGVSTLWLTAALFSQMVDMQAGSLEGVRQLLAGGEALSVPHVRRMLSRLAPGARLINGYGPTENTTFTCCHVMTRESVIERSVPIGRPIANTRVYVLDGHGQPVPVGVPGELYIAGDGLARGYWHRAELTGERFVRDPFDGSGEGRMYRTGDRVRYRADGALEFLGRLDDQVKVRGYRIELGEIEAVLGEHAGVKDTVVLCREDEPGEKRLVAYFVAEGGHELSGNELKETLRRELPDYMVPSLYVSLDKLPLTPNGKVDQRVLPVPDVESSRREYVGPRTDTERALVDIWAEVLRLDRVGIHDDFFDLGGHSLLGIRLVSRIESHLGMSLPLSALFRFTTVEQMASTIDTSVTHGGPRSDGTVEAGGARVRLTEEEYRKLATMIAGCPLPSVRPGSLMLALHADGREPPLFWCCNGPSRELPRLACELGPDQPLYGLFSGSQVVEQNDAWRRRVAHHYAEEIMEVQPAGPYRLGGNCGGAWVAIEIAFELLARGKDVERLCSMEYFEPRLFDYTRPLQILCGQESYLRIQEQFHWKQPGWEKRFRNIPRVNWIRGEHGTYFTESNVAVLGQRVQRFLRHGVGNMLNSPEPNLSEQAPGESSADDNLGTARREVIVVLGMHRSGTSALTRVINLLGADITAKLMVTGADNETGFWESQKIADLDDELLASFDSYWHDWRRFHFDSLHPSAKEEFKARALAILEWDFSESAFLVLKDPRICRLLPFWLDVLRDFGADTKCVLSIRNPFEVSASLKKRDGFTQAKSLVLWLRNVLDAEYGSRGLTRVFLSYEGLLEDWRQTVARLSNQLDVAWPPGSEAAEAGIDRFLEHDRRHHVIGDERVLDNLEVHEWVRETYAALKMLQTHPESKEALTRLDEVRAEFNRASDALGEELRYQEAAQLASSARIDKLHEDLVSVEQQKAAALARIDELQEDLASVEQQKAAALLLKNQVLHRLNEIQTSAAWQLAHPLRVAEFRMPGFVRAIAAFSKLVWWTLTLRLPGRLRLRGEANSLLASGLFDFPWYVGQNPDVVLNGGNPIMHWLVAGWKEGRDPNPRFDMDGYLAQNPDVTDAGLKPLLQYLSRDPAEGRDRDLAQNADVPDAGLKSPLRKKGLCPDRNDMHDDLSVM